MRVIAGKARSIPLKTVEGLDTRPTTDRIKETLFNMLHNELADCLFIDLFSGSGGIGIEALSRGAGKAIFVEKSPKAVSCIKENLLKTKLEEENKLLRAKTETLQNAKHSEEIYEKAIAAMKKYNGLGEDDEYDIN